MNNLMDAERAAMKWLKADMLRAEVLRMAVMILQHRTRIRSFTLSANDVKAAWACLCRTAPQMESGALILRYRSSPDSDSEDSSYDPEKDDDMCVDPPEIGDAADGTEFKLECDEELIVLGPDSETESDEDTEEGKRVAKKRSPGDNGDQEMAESDVSLVANALLESTAPPEVFNQLQVRLPPTGSYPLFRVDFLSQPNARRFDISLFERVRKRRAVRSRALYGTVLGSKFFFGYTRYRRLPTAIDCSRRLCHPTI